MSRFSLISVIVLLYWYAPPARSQDLIISGVMNGDISIVRSIELYTINDIPDLSLYSIGTAMNGSSTLNPDFTLSGSAQAGDYIYLAHDSQKFIDFFGFSPDFETGVIAITGDDVVGLFQGAVVVDIFGELGVDGTGQSWEYTDGWA